MRIFDHENYRIELPNRDYDIRHYRNYVDWLQGKPREKEFKCHCFAVFDPELMSLIDHYIETHGDFECYKQPIYSHHLKEI